jgi:hypothetical protein
MTVEKSLGLSPHRDSKICLTYQLGYGHERMKKMNFEQIRDTEPKNSDRWLYAAVRAANSEHPAHIFALLEELKYRTPREIIRLFPPTKEYDGARLGCKDYFTTMETVQKRGLDRQLGHRVKKFLWDYLNPHLNELYFSYMYCHIRRLPIRARAVIRAYLRKVPILSMKDLCMDCTDSESVIVLDIVSSVADRLYQVGQDMAIDQRTFLRAKEELRQFIGDERLDMCESMLRNSATMHSLNLEISFGACLLTRKQIKAVKGDLADDLLKARKKYGIVGRVMKGAGHDMYPLRVSTPTMS